MLDKFAFIASNLVYFALKHLLCSEISYTVLQQKFLIIISV